MMLMTNWKGRVGTGAGVGAVTVALTMLLAPAPNLGAQGIPYRGEDISPVYEGWRTLPDGSHELLFGYFNRDPADIRNLERRGGGGLLDIGCYAVTHPLRVAQRFSGGSCPH